jgi:hypothetical protein
VAHFDKTVSMQLRSGHVPHPSRFFCEGWVKAGPKAVTQITRKRQILNSKGRIYPQMLQYFKEATITMNEYRK